MKHILRHMTEKELKQMRRRGRYIRAKQRARRNADFILLVIGGVTLVISLFLQTLGLWAIISFGVMTFMFARHQKPRAHWDTHTKPRHD